MAGDSSSESSSSASSSDNESTNASTSSSSSSGHTTSGSSRMSNESTKKNKRKRKGSISSTSKDERVKKRKHSKPRCHTRERNAGIAKKFRKQRDVNENQKSVEDNECSDVPITLMDRSKSLGPMGKDQWEKHQSTVKKVIDEVTGRQRLVKGDGEVMEEIVSKEQHKNINKQATKRDGDYFQTRITTTISTKKK